MDEVLTNEQLTILLNKTISELEEVKKSLKSLRNSFNDVRECYHLD